jgi:hypothetical protein
VGAQAAGRDVRYWQVRNAQHFDAFLALPDYAPLRRCCRTCTPRSIASPRTRRSL